jgi:hypothetical protein
MNIQNCKLMIIVLAIIAGGALILMPTTSAGQDTGLEDKLIDIAASSNLAATTIPLLWTAGGLDSGSTGAGQAARMAVDASGNVTVVSGPGFYTRLVLTSYTSKGALRWQSTLDPISGSFRGYWVAAAANGDIVALGLQYSSSGLSAVTLARFASDGTFQWRVDSIGTVLSVGRMVVDASGNAYFSYNSTLYKYSPSGILLWSTYTSVPDVAAALSPDGADIVLTGTPRGGGGWITGAFNTATGARRWLVTAPEGTAAIDLVVNGACVYVTGQGYTGAGTPALAYFLTVVAYDRATGARLWRTDSRPGSLTQATGLRIALAPDGSLVVAGQTSGAAVYLDWWIVALEANGAVKWQVMRDRTTATDEVPASVFVLADGTTVRDLLPARGNCRLRPEWSAAMGGLLQGGDGLGHGAARR